MPQVFHVLRCYSCKTFQVHQVKKATRWSCKLCGGKQSVKNVYGEGSGADCRRHVQKLNMLRAAAEEPTLPPRAQTHEILPPTYEALPPTHETACYVIVSKWGQYVTQVDDKEGLDDDTSNDVKFTLDRRTFDESKRKRIHPDRVVRVQKRKCSNGVAQPGNSQHRAVYMSSGSCSYPGEFKPTPQLDTSRNIAHQPCVDQVTDISTDMPTQSTEGILGDNISSVTHAQVFCDRTGFLSESTNTIHASRNVLLSRHPDRHQNTKAVVPALSGDCKQRVKKDRNLEKELLAAGSKWAQFITPEEDADSSDGEASESEQSTFPDYNENIPNIRRL
ncbi:hypothetical protein NP493_466g05009 [Ridgeia piscesae]|uniref:MRN complex-interacting protein N-terminal domain-containing protein n=1 Tax=Ridgeia piscesae TaxID=27915 RepID=A0AAD9KZU6_RIDPI|nr:hypothetical protein NP493_466g05009 [Ridgeia piscesae]